MGGVCRQSWKFFESKAISLKVEKNAEIFILQGFLVCCVSVWYFRITETFTQGIIYLKNTCIFAPVLKNPRKLNSDLFCDVDHPFLGGHSALLRHKCRLATFVVAKELHFWRCIFQINQKSSKFKSKKVTRFPVCINWKKARENYGENRNFVGMRSAAKCECDP